MDGKQVFSLSESQQKSFAAMFVLDRMLRKNKRYSVVPQNGDEQCLVESLKVLHLDDLIAIDGKGWYVPTDKGRDRVRLFRQRYEEFLSVFDIFCAVDLAAGEFAFSSYYDFPDDESWKRFLAQDRWEDLRVAVAIHKGLDPLEIVFMSFVMEGRFADNPDGKWEIGLLSGDLWNGIVDIVNSNLHPNQLGYHMPAPDDPGRTIEVTGEDVLTDVISRGATVMFDLMRKGKELSELEAQQPALSPPLQTETVVETVEETVYDYDFVVPDPLVYYAPYANPWYVSPVWTTPVYPAITIVI